MLPVAGDEPQDLDLIVLKTGAILDGVLISETATHVNMECVGGKLSLPASAVQKIVRARPGESQIKLALKLIERNKLEKAEGFINEAKKFTAWKTACNEAQKQIAYTRKKAEDEKRIKQENAIKNIINTRGLEAGLAALRRQQREPKDDYWGKTRGRLHVMLAVERLDHLDFKDAERQLSLAERYGADEKEWQSVKDQLVSMRRMSMLRGRDYLLEKLKNRSKNAPRKYSGDLIAKVKQAKEAGERVPPLNLVQLVERYSNVHDLDPLLVWALIDTESSWQPRVVSHKGAQGLMQLMPMTAKDLEVRDPFNPEENIRGGTQYLQFLLKMFNDTDTALAAYNVGPGRVERSESIPKAGLVYIQKVRKRYAALQKKFG